MRHEERGHGGDVDDLTVAAREHGLSLGLATHEEAARVHVESRVPVGHGRVLGRRVLVDAGVVDGDVERAPTLQARRDLRDGMNGNER